MHVIFSDEILGIFLKLCGGKNCTFVGWQREARRLKKQPEECAVCGCTKKSPFCDHGGTPGFLASEFPPGGKRQRGSQSHINAQKASESQAGSWWKTQHQLGVSRNFSLVGRNLACIFTYWCTSLYSGGGCPCDTPCGWGHRQESKGNGLRVRTAEE